MPQSLGDRNNRGEVMASQKESPLEAKLAEMQQGVDAGKSLAVITAEAKDVAVSRREAQQAAVIDAVSSFDWKHVPPPQLAQVLCRIPFKGGANEPDFYLQPWQALIFAMRCFELGLSPFSGEVWYNPKVNKVNVTLEGKMKLARDRGYNFGPPHFERKVQPWPKSKTANLPPGVTEDIGYKCTMKLMGLNEDAEYTAWMSEWYVSRSPVWKEKTEHMLQLRAYEKCISFASGAGTSEMPGEADIDGSAAPAAVMPQIDVVTTNVQPE